MIKLPIQEEHVSVRRTYLLLMKALLDLLAEMPFEKISLTDLCRVSMISRSTFYRYFEDKYDLLHYCVNMYIEGLRPVEDLIYFKSTDSLRQFLEYLIAQVDENITLYRRIYQTNKNGSLMFTIQGDLAKILTESGWQGENQGVRLKIPLPLYVSFMSSFYLTTLRSYLELADEYDAKTFVESVCRFALRDFCTETVMHVFIASAGVFVTCMFPIHQFLYLFSTSHGLFSIPLRHTQNLSLPKTSSGKCSNRTGCSLPS